MKTWFNICCAAVVIFLFFPEAHCFASGSSSKTFIYSVRFDSQGKRLAVGKSDGSIFVWDREVKEIIWSYNSPSRPVLNVFFFNNDRELVACELYGSIKVFNALSGKLIKNFVPRFGHFRLYQDGAVEATLAAADMDGDILALTDNQQSTVALLDMKAVMQESEGEDLFLSNGDFVQIVETGEALWMKTDQAQSKAVIAELYHAPTRAVLTDIRFCPACPYLAATTSVGVLLLWEISGLRSSDSKKALQGASPYYIRKITSSQDKYRELTGLAVSGGGHLATFPFSCRRYGQIQLWNTVRGEMLDNKFEAHPGRAWRGAFDTSGRYLITLGDIRFILWEIKNNELVARGKIHFGANIYDYSQLNNIHFSPKGSIVALGVTDVFIIDVPKMKILEHIGSTQANLVMDRFDVQPR